MARYSTAAGNSGHRSQPHQNCVHVSANFTCTRQNSETFGRVILPSQIDWDLADNQSNGKSENRLRYPIFKVHG